MDPGPLGGPFTSPELHQTFSWLTFLQVISGLALLSSDTSFNHVDRVALAFWIYDVNGNGRVESAEILAQHQHQHLTIPADVEADLRQLQDADGGFDFEAFLKLVQQRPGLLAAPLEAARRRLSQVVGEVQLRNAAHETVAVW